MPSILFIMKYPLHRRENLNAKFNGQMEAARALGWDAYCIGWDSRGMVLVGNGKREFLRKNTLAKRQGIRSHENIHRFDEGGERSDAPHHLRRALSAVYADVSGCAANCEVQLKERGGQLIIEYPTYPIAQENERFFLRSLVFRYTDAILQRINPMVDLYALIGDDCGGTLYGRPAMNTVNGIDVGSLPKHAPRANTKDIRLLALASMSGWHGYDRILRSLAGYGGRRGRTY